MHPAPGLAACTAQSHLAGVTLRRPALIVVLAGALAALTLARLPAAWQSGNALNHVSGAWMTLADDLARGTFYRPLDESGLGFGGTRFFPLAFAAHAALLRAGAPLLASGFALSLGAALLLGGALALLLRRLGLDRLTSAALAALAFAGFAGQHAIAAIRGDLLAVALEAGGLAIVAGAPRRRVVPLAALLFTLAFAAKPTALTAPAAAVAFLGLGGKLRPALALALLTSAGAALVIGLTEALSGGRFLTLLAQCAAGGARPADLARAPLRLAGQFLLGDRAGLVLLAAGATALAALPRRRSGLRAPVPPGVRLTGLWGAAAVGGALLVFSSPGTGVNHLLELEAASAAVLGACLAAGGAAARVARLAAPAAAAAGLVVAGGLWREDLSTSRLAEARAALAGLPPGGALVSEDPLVPLVAGERPLVLDPWMLRLAAARDPAVERPLVAALAARAPRAVVLLKNVAAPGADAWYAQGNLGLAPIAEVRRGFRLASRAGRYWIYVPAPPATAAPDVVVAASRDPAAARTTPISSASAPLRPAESASPPGRADAPGRAPPRRAAPPP